MQYYSPYNGYSNSDFPFTPVSAPTPTLLQRSQIVGEGDVTSLTLPDGSLQLYFIPLTRGASTCIGNYCGPVPAWFIRTIPNIFPVPQQPQLASNYREPPPIKNSFLYDGLSGEIPKQQLSFHNDKQTSSTDFHCFSRQAASFSVYPRQSAEIQAGPGWPYEPHCKSCSCDRPRPEQRTSYMSVDCIIPDERPTCSYQFVQPNNVRVGSNSFNRCLR